MATFGIGIKDFKYPDFVNEIFAEIQPKLKDEIVKNIILSNVEKHENGFEISKLMQVKSNRVSILPNVKSVLGSLYWFTKLYPHEFDGITKYVNLTEDLLNEIGFVQHSKSWKKNDVEIGYIDKDDVFQYEVKTGKYIDIEYFNQLQNIYFIKTGDKLSL